jgi:hypothetical protein
MAKMPDGTRGFTMGRGKGLAEAARAAISRLKRTAAPFQPPAPTGAGAGVGTGLEVEAGAGAGAGVGGYTTGKQLEAAAGSGAGAGAPTLAQDVTLSPEATEDAEQ